jgi:hypothetical protein
VSLELITEDGLWALAKIACFAVIAMWLFHIQKNPVNGVNLLEFIQDPSTDKFSGFRLAYMVALWATTYKFVFTDLRGGDLAYVMFTYGGLWVAGQSVAKYIDRPPDPPAPNPPAAAPGVVVNNQPGIGP